MKIAIGIALGLFLGLTFNRIPHYKLFYRVLPETPEGWTPKMRTWIKGVEQK